MFGCMYSFSEISSWIQRVWAEIASSKHTFISLPATESLTSVAAEEDMKRPKEKPRPPAGGE